MILPIIISLAIIVTTIIMHGIGTVLWLNYLLRKHDVKSNSFGYFQSMKVLSFTAVFFMVLHYSEIALWAFIFLLIPELHVLNHWEEAIYFSTITYTTVGYGDITLPSVWRIMSGFEAMNGILLFGWSTAMFYAIVQKIIFSLTKKKSIDE